MDSEKGNRVFARGAQCAPPPPWFLEPKKSLVWMGLNQSTNGEFFKYDPIFEMKSILNENVVVSKCLPVPNILQ